MSATAASEVRSNHGRHASIGLILLAAACAVFLTVGRFGNQVEVSRHVKISADIQELDAELEGYRHSHSSYPNSIRPLKDPWGNDYVYVCPGRKNPDKYDLFSAGQDHRPDTADDDWGGN
jgi:type II secretion system (T2SS) protein G